MSQILNKLEIGWPRKHTMRMALISFMVIDVVSLSLFVSSMRTCRKSLFELFSPFPVTVIRFSMAESKSLSIHWETFLVLLSIPCKSNKARAGKRSETFGFPSNTISSDTTALNSTPIAAPSSPSNVSPQIILIIAFVAVRKAKSPTFMGQPIFFWYTYLMDFLTSTLL
ncbi:hypothetical protein V8G54_004275 [Vigna mungo]|uniref:Uncharacterized protein n=1 Tax=Vigna mungo TaxID=3915 RepID=A0AAQ3PD70_VIGMU